MAPRPGPSSRRSRPRPRTRPSPPPRNRPRPRSPAPSRARRRAGRRRRCGPSSRSYFSLVTSAPESSYVMLTPEFQDASGGFERYSGFWSTISSARPYDITFDPRHARHVVHDRLRRHLGPDLDRAEAAAARPGRRGLPHRRRGLNRTNGQGLRGAGGARTHDPRKRSGPDHAVSLSALSRSERVILPDPQLPQNTPVHRKVGNRWGMKSLHFSPLGLAQQVSLNEQKLSVGHLLRRRPRAAVPPATAPPRTVHPRLAGWVVPMDLEGRRTALLWRSSRSQSVTESANPADFDRAGVLEVSGPSRDSHANSFAAHGRCDLEPWLGRTLDDLCTCSPPDSVKDRSTVASDQPFQSKGPTNFDGSRYFDTG